MIDPKFPDAPPASDARVTDFVMNVFPSFSDVIAPSGKGHSVTSAPSFTSAKSIVNVASSFENLFHAPSSSSSTSL